MTQGQSEGRVGAELHMLAGREQGLQTSRALASTGELPLLGSGFEPISEQPCLKGFSSDSFTCHVSVILLTSITAVSSSASCLVDIGLFCRKDAFNRAGGGPRVGERPWQLPRADLTHCVPKSEPCHGQRAFLSLACQSSSLQPRGLHTASWVLPSSCHGCLNPRPGWDLPSWGKIGTTALQTGPVGMKPVTSGSALTRINTRYFQDRLCWAGADVEIF